MNAKEPKSGGMGQPFVVFMINGKADHVMTYEESGVVRGVIEMDGKKYDLKDCEELHQYGQWLCQ